MGDRVMQKTPTFDCSVPELFGPLMVGATMVILAEGGHTDPKQVYDEIVRSHTTMVHRAVDACGVPRGDRPAARSSA